MISGEIRKRFLDFFKEKGHAIVSSSSLVPNDPSVLLTTAGMQQFKKYFTGELNAMSDFKSRRTVSIQKCFRTSDIEEVGDDTHLTFFEMMGNFSFGPVGSDDPKDKQTEGYFKRSAIVWGYEFLTKELGISSKRIAASIFKGDKEVPRDEESYAIWQNDIGLPKSHIKESGRADNFWGPTGVEGPCGPTSEIYVDGIEVWNLVFNEYNCYVGKRLEKLKNPGIDTGMGFERLAAVLQGVKNVFETDVLQPIVTRVQEIAPHLDTREVRIFADHIRAAVFLVSDGVIPSNKEAGYVLRRHIRRMLAFQIKYDVRINFVVELVPIVTNIYLQSYKDLKPSGDIIRVIEEERLRFESALRDGKLEIEKHKVSGESINAKKAFFLYETLGIPFELIFELAPKELTKNLKKEDFDAEFAEHQKISRVGQEKKFGGHGLVLDTGELKAWNKDELEKVTRLHTATHLLHQALREVLGNDVRQMGSDITVERTRFDFLFPRKLSSDERLMIEQKVNGKIKENLPVRFEEMAKEEAEKTGALHFFKAKYPDLVRVYYIASEKGGIASAWSKEFCGGPHVTHTGEIGKFKITKEEAVAAGVRRIRATVE